MKFVELGSNLKSLGVLSGRQRMHSEGGSFRLGTEGIVGFLLLKVI